MSVELLLRNLRMHVWRFTDRELSELLRIAGQETLSRDCAAGQLVWRARRQLERMMLAKLHARPTA